MVKKDRRVRVNKDTLDEMKIEYPNVRPSELIKVLWIDYKRGRKKPKWLV